MHIAHRNGHRVYLGIARKYRCLCRVRSRRTRPILVAHDADFALARHPGAMRKFRNRRRLINVLRQPVPRSVIHHRCKSPVNRLAYLLHSVAMVQMHHHRHRCRFRQMQQHRGHHSQWRMRAASRASLQYQRAIFRLCRRHIGARIFPAKAHDTAHGIPLAQGRAQHIGKGCKRHLNLAIISLMPGMVSIW